MHALIAGCGYLGRRAAAAWQAAGDRVTALTRSTKNAESLRAAGAHPVTGDLLDPRTLRALPAADVLLIAVTHDPRSPVSRRALLVDGIAGLVRELRCRVGHVIYVSSTSVYGQTDGTWVDESSPCEPATEGGRICLAAEDTLAALLDDGAAPCRLTILRLAGIYGPGRLIARVDQLRSGAAVPGSPQAWLNLIHVEDAAECIVAASRGRHTWRTILVCDDRPLTRGEFYAAVARAMSAPPPVFDPQANGGRRTAGLNKRCCNARMHAELQVRLQYPDAIAALPNVTSPGIHGASPARSEPSE